MKRVLTTKIKDKLKALYYNDFPDAKAFIKMQKAQLFPPVPLVPPEKHSEQANITNS